MASEGESVHRKSVDDHKALLMGELDALAGSTTGKRAVTFDTLPKRVAQSVFGVYIGGERSKCGVCHQDARLSGLFLGVSHFCEEVRDLSRTRGLDIVHIVPVWVIAEDRRVLLGKDWDLDHTSPIRAPIASFCFCGRITQLYKYTKRCVVLVPLRIGENTRQCRECHSLSTFSYIGVALVADCGRQRDGVAHHCVNVTTEERRPL